MIIQTLEKTDYPPQLLEVPEPPARLYIRGTMPPNDSLFLTVVGSRRYTGYGKEVCEKLISELAGSGIVIVSGLALGIDAIAHKAALEAGLTTVAFPGSGLNQAVLYPSANRRLAEKIVDSGGALLSEFEPDFRATQYAFPQRNRLMAGISRGVLIIEAEEKSGTLITARLATDYNRDVFSVPGSLFSRTSIGTNWLLKQGAIPVTSGKDILEQWNLRAHDNPEDSKALGTSDDNDENSARTMRVLEECSDEERKILELLREPLSKDNLVRLSGLPVSEVNVILSSLEIRGIIKESMGEIRVHM